MGQASPIHNQRLWNAEDKAEAIQMYKDGASYTQIGVKLDRTRGQVAGKLNRENVLKKRVRVRELPKPRIFAEGHSQITLKKPIQTQRRVRLKLIESDTAVTIKELEGHHCKWPLGDPKQPDFRYCGCQRNDKSPYCAEHTRTAGRLYVKADAA